MNIELLREYLLSKKGAEECFPFNDTALVLKVMGKMFAIVSLDGDLSMSLKCDPAKAIELREQYSCVIPGYHTDKKHWNTVYVDGSVSDALIQEWIDHSYSLVVEKLTKNDKARLSEMM